MPFHYVQRQPEEPTYTGTQYILAGGSFDLQGDAEFELDPASYTYPGTYVLIDYSAAGASFTYPGAYASGQAALNALFTVTGTGLVGMTIADPHGTVQIDRNIITVTLV